MPRALLPMVLFAALAVWILGRWSGETAEWSAVKQQIRDEFPTVEQVSVESLHAWLTSGRRPPLLLDVREEVEYRVSHLPGAVRVDPAGPAPTLPQELDPDTAVVVYCSVGYRSSRFAERLTALGYDRVANLDGSIFEWANKGYPVVRDGLEVRQVHPYDARWGRWLDPKLRAISAE